MRIFLLTAVIALTVCGAFKPHTVKSKGKSGWVKSTSHAEHLAKHAARDALVSICFVAGGTAVEAVRYETPQCEAVTDGSPCLYSCTVEASAYCMRK